MFVFEVYQNSQYCMISAITIEMFLAAEFATKAIFIQQKLFTWLRGTDNCGKTTKENVTIMKCWCCNFDSLYENIRRNVKEDFAKNPFGNVLFFGLIFIDCCFVGPTHCFLLPGKTRDLLLRIV